VVIYQSLLAKSSAIMQDLQKLETQELIDLMSRMTSELTTNISGKNTIINQQFEYDLSLIQNEINLRRITKDNTTVSDNPPEFTPDNT
jgi:hypothetical protein